MIAWMSYSIAVAVLLGGAALAAERFLRLFGKAGRWVWVGAFIAAVSLPAIGLAVPDTKLPLPILSETGFAGNSFATSVLQLPNRVLVGSGSGALGFDSAILIVWIVGSLLLLTLFCWSWWRLDRDTRSCASARVAGIPVLVSSVLGPAVVGVRKQAIVLPSWVLECEEGVRAMIARHELEHVRSGDQRIVLAAFLIVLLLPWNAVLWWYSARLRLAVEVDCDFRLLRSGANLRTYSRLLLEVGTRLGSAPVAALAFSRSRSSLFRRIQLMTSKPRRRFAQATGAVAVALALVLLACEMPLPLQEESAEAQTALTASVPEVLMPDTVSVIVRPNVVMVSDTTVEVHPLIIIDGVIIGPESGFDLQSLEAESIERIEVVKGDAAEALYGERAAGGVINIYLKTEVQNQGEGSSGS